MNIKLLYTALNIAVDACDAIKQIYEEGDFNVSVKSDSSPLTRADLASNRIIYKELEQTKIPVLSEEGNNILYDERKNWEYLWLVDPLDGTKEFIKRNGEFTVNIALVHRGVPVLGVVAIPAQDMFYCSLNGYGAYKIDKTTIKSTKGELDFLKKYGSKLPLQKLPGKITVVGSRSHSSKETEEFVDKLKNEHGEIDFISKGSALKLCMIAEGKAHVYPRLAPTMEWDTAAGQALILETKGKVLEFESKSELKYNRENLRNPWFIAFAGGFDLNSHRDKLMNSSG